MTGIKTNKEKTIIEKVINETDKYKLEVKYLNGKISDIVFSKKGRRKRLYNSPTELHKKDLSYHLNAFSEIRDLANEMIHLLRKDQNKRDIENLEKEKE